MLELAAAPVSLDLIKETPTKEALPKVHQILLGRKRFFENVFSKFTETDDDIHPLPCKPFPPLPLIKFPSNTTCCDAY
jgi:hypothetical protein